MRGFSQLLYHPPPTLLLILPLSGLTFLLIAAAASLSLSVGGADARDILAKKTNRRNKNSGSSRCSSSMQSGAKSMSSGGSSGSYAYGSMAGGKFKKVKAKSMKACFDACVDTANCETFVYVLTSTEVREKGGDSHSRYAPRSFARYKKEGKRCKVETSGGKVMYCADKASKKKGELVGVVTAAKEAQLIGGDTGGVGGQAGAYTWTQVAAHDTPGDCWYASLFCRVEGWTRPATGRRPVRPHEIRLHQARIISHRCDCSSGPCWEGMFTISRASRRHTRAVA